MIYQESIMRVAQHFAGYSLTEADNLRKACGKKIRAMMALEREKFLAGCERTGYGRALGEGLFAIIEPFADYAFPKAHAYCYGMVAYQTAWLKAHHPVEYMAALLTSVKDDKDKTAVYLAECRSLGISVMVPDVNLSASDFTARDGCIPFGLSAVRNVGEGLVVHVVAGRQTGPFTDFYDFCERVDMGALNKRSLEALIKAGAFDCVGHPRKGLLSVFELIVDRTVARRRERDLGVLSLFGEVADGPSAVHDERVPIPEVEFDPVARLAHEKEMLGLYVSSHPLTGNEAAVRRCSDCSIRELMETGSDGEIRRVGGVATNVARRYTRRGDLMATFTLEDLDSAVEVMVFPKTMAEYGSVLADDAIVCVKGRLDRREDLPKIVCVEITRPDLSVDKSTPVRIKLASSSLTASVLGKLKGLLREHPGDTPVLVHLDESSDRDPEGGIVLRLPREFSVDSRNGLYAELRVLLGPNGLVT